MVSRDTLRCWTVCGDGEITIGSMRRRRPCCQRMRAFCFNARPADGVRRKRLVDGDELLKTIHLNQLIDVFVWIGIAVGSWFFISVTSSVRKSFAEMVAESLSALPPAVVAWLLTACALAEWCAVEAWFKIPMICVAIKSVPSFRT